MLVTFTYDTETKEYTLDAGDMDASNLVGLTFYSEKYCYRTDDDGNRIPELHMSFNDKDKVEKTEKVTRVTASMGSLLSELANATKE